MEVGSVPFIDENWHSNFSSMSISTQISSDDTLTEAYLELVKNQRISAQTGLNLLTSAPLSGLMQLADMVKQARFQNYVFFNENLHVNPTNICVLACRFCAFRKGPRHSESYELNVGEYLHRIEPFATKVDEVHSVGGLHPSWGVEHYEELYRNCKQCFPHIHIKSLTAVEIKHLANRSNLSVKEVLSRLQSAGLDSIPGGGAEILVDKIRDRICRGKESSQEYLDIHSTAHTLGIRTNCTMLFGTIEAPIDRITHLCKLRELQDQTGGFQCFVPYPFLPDKTRLPDAQLATSNEILRMIAVSRLMLDNISHIKAYRMNIGDSVAQIALSGGADDIDGTVGHEEIMHSAGSRTPLGTTSEELCKLIREVGNVPVKRNSVYSEFQIIESSPISQRSLPIISI